MEAEHLHQLAEARDTAQQDLHDAVVQAIREGHTRVWVAEHSGITRVTINKWIREEEQ